MRNDRYVMTLGVNVVGYGVVDVLVYMNDFVEVLDLEKSVRLLSVYKGVRKKLEVLSEEEIDEAYLMLLNEVYEECGIENNLYGGVRCVE